MFNRDCGNNAYYKASFVIRMLKQRKYFFLLLFVKKYTFSTSYNKEKSLIIVDYQGFEVPRDAFEIIKVGKMWVKRKMQKSTVI